MLTELRISHFALIESLELEFSPGFQVFTGETGAGKSLLVDALILLLGGRASAEHIRSGAKEATLEAVFSLSGHALILEKLKEWDLLPEGTQDLLLRRTLSREGRNRMYVNGRLVPLHQMVELGGWLVDIHGQHEQQSLLSPKVQLNVLDAFGGLLALRDEYAARYHRWQELVRAATDAVQRAKERQEREEFLHFQSEELGKAQLVTGEDEALVREHRKLQNSGRVLEIINQAYDLLYGNQESVLSRLTEVRKLVHELGEIDDNVRNWHESIEGGIAQVEELVLAARNYKDGFEHDPARLAQIDERLALLQRLKKKYRESLEDLLARQTRIQSELEELANIEERTQDLQQQVSQAYQDALVSGRKLSEARQAVTRKLEERITAELAHLMMDKSRFHVGLTAISEMEQAGPNGLDQIEFAFCANPGESLHPLARVASGGELSRLMLALKTVLASVDQVPVLIFDEVDAGIGGNVASTMGQRLKALGQTHQVMCITHLPQIAAQAHHHYLVKKESVDKRTMAMVTHLSAEEREEEIARMLGGATMTQTVRKAAGEMLNSTN
ncbi:MAG: DNA repair protein RecN [Nitrospira sp.]|nr:DNA repair protein RecN [Nitrospira sp.]MDE0486044.1 DNA repair protein RecN [Nitrospira sp.]